MAYFAAISKWLGPWGADLFIGKRPHAAFGNSTGDREMLEWTALALALG